MSNFLNSTISDEEYIRLMVELGRSPEDRLRFPELPYDLFCYRNGVVGLRSSILLSEGTRKIRYSVYLQFNCPGSLRQACSGLGLDYLLTPVKVSFMSCENKQQDKTVLIPRDRNA